MAQKENIILSKKQKWQLYLVRPLIISIFSFVIIFMIEMDWPGVSFIGIPIGLFTASFFMGIFFPGLVTYKGTNNPTRKQKIGKYILYTIIYGALLFIVIRFLIMV